MILKRLLDISVALFGILLTGLPMAVIALLIKLESPGPVIYRSRRMGRYGKVFRIMKFRTMVQGADTTGPGVTYKGDNRITRVGGFLRDSKLDELPQLFNVLKGEMSLVGPRAEDPRYRHVFEGENRRVLEMPPGMTGLSWVELKAFHEENIDAGEDWERHYLEVSLPRKIEVDLKYVKTYSTLLDLQILFRTFAGLMARGEPEQRDNAQ